MPIKKQQGFSLIELLIVLGLMTAAATIALSSVDNNANQNSFNETRIKLELIRKAILGEEINNFNGLPISTSGFVADMGRAPITIEELFIEPDCDPDTAGIQCPWLYDSANEIWSGWHGPYINVIGNDYLDGWGNTWEWDTSVDGELTIRSHGLDWDSNASILSIDLEDTPDEDFANPAFLSQTISTSSFSAALPLNPLHLNIPKAPFCGQCKDGTNLVEADCTTAGHEWNPYLKYCVEDTATTPTECGAIVSEETTWTPLFDGYCSGSTYNNKTECETNTEIWTNISGGSCSNITYTTKNECEDNTEVWTPLDVLKDCTIYGDSNPTPAFSFIGTEPNICARIIRIHNGQVIVNTHKNPDTLTFPMQESLAFNDFITFNNNVIEDITVPLGLPLPLGQFRIGLYIKDGVGCTTTPFPTASAQAISDVFTISGKRAPNIGTSTNPIQLKWRSQ